MLQKSLGFNMRALEEIFSLVMTSLSPGVACQSYLALHTLWTQIETVNKAQQENRQSRSGFAETYARFSEVVIGPNMRGIGLDNQIFSA